MKRFFNRCIKSLSLIFAATVISGMILGCTDLMSGNEKKNDSGITNISFSLVSGIGSARTALPTFAWDDFVYDFTVIELGENNVAVETKDIVVKKPFSVLENGKVPLKKSCTYKFVLTGFSSDGENYKKVIEGITVANLFQNNQIIQFKMLPVEEGKGTLYLNLIFPNDGVIKTVKANISTFRDATNLTDVSISTVDEKKSAQFIKENVVDAGKTQYANIYCYDVKENVVFSYSESIYMLNGKTSASVIEITADDYYLNNITVDIKKNGSEWTDAPSQIVLVDKTDPSKEYVFNGTNGQYSGYIPDGEYEIFIKKDGDATKIDTGSSINTASQNEVEVGVVTVTLPQEEGLVFKPSSVTGNGIIFDSTNGSGGTEVIVPAGQDFKVEVSVAEGYKEPESGTITVNGNNTTLTEGKADVTYTAGSTPGAISSGVTEWTPECIIYTYEYSLPNGWVDGTTDEYKFNLTDESYKYTVKQSPSLVSDYSHIKVEDGQEVIGWKIYKKDGVEVSSSQTITQIPLGTTGNLILRPVTKASNQVQYTTQIWVENIDDDNYSMVWSFVSYAVAGAEVTSEVHGEWLSNYDATQDTQIIASDGSTVLRTEFKRKRYTLTLNGNGGKWGGDTSKSLTGKFEAAVSIENPVKENALFTGWLRASDSQVVSSLPATFAATETYTAQYNSYMIETKYEKLEGGYDSTIAVKAGTPGDVVSVSATPVEGYNDPIVVPATVTPDGSAIVTVTYNRKTVVLTFDPTTGAKWSDDNTTGNATISGKYGAAVNFTRVPTKSGYEFKKWAPDVPSTFPASNATFTATWNQTGAKYKVEVYVENTSGGYDLDANHSEEKFAEIGTTPTEAEITAELPDMTGFTRTVDLKPVTADGTAVQTVKYTRKSITYTFKLNGGNISGNTSDVVRVGKYGTAVSLPVNPTKDKFKFVKWNGYTASDSIFGLTDKNFTAVWETSITGTGENPMLNDIELVVTGTTNIVATVRVPYAEGNWSIIWIVDGVLRTEDHGSSITIQNATPGKIYTIYVEATDTSLPYELTFSKEVDYSITNAN